MRRRVIGTIERDVKMIIRVKQDNTVPNCGDFSRAAGEAQLSRKLKKKKNELSNMSCCVSIIKCHCLKGVRMCSSLR